MGEYVGIREWIPNSKCNFKRTIAVDIDEFMIDRFYTDVLKRLGCSSRNSGYYIFKELLITMMIDEDDVDIAVQSIKVITEKGAVRLKEKYGKSYTYSNIEKNGRIVIMNMYDHKDDNDLFYKVFGDIRNLSEYNFGYVLWSLYDYGIKHIQDELIIPIIKTAVGAGIKNNGLQIPEKLQLNIELSREELLSMISLGFVNK